MASSLVFFTSIACLALAISHLTAQTAEETIIAQIFRNYSKGQRPVPLGKPREPTEVQVSLFLASINSVDELKMEYTADIFMRQLWNDPRLSFLDLSQKTGASYVSLSQDSAVQPIWVPDVFFNTMRSGQQMTITVPNRLTKISPNGDVLLSARYIATFGCKMDFRLYPFDTQYCLVELGAYASTTDALLLQWRPNASLMIENDFELPKFVLESYDTVECSKTVAVVGNFSCLKYQLNLKRQSQFHIVETFLPTSLLVVASWLGFWVDAAAAPARVSLPCVMMLSTITLASSVKTSLPPVSYIKAIDLWFGSCIGFIFLSLLQYGIVMHLRNKDLETIAPNAQTSPVAVNNPKPPQSVPDNGRKSSSGKDLVRWIWKLLPGFGRFKCPPSKSYRLVDFYSRLIFPASFLLFLVLFATELRFLPVTLK